MPLPNYIQPGLYINGLPIGISTAFTTSRIGSDHPKLAGISEYNDTKITINSPMLKGTVDTAIAGHRTPNLSIIKPDQSSNINDDDVLFVKDPHNSRNEITIGYIDVPRQVDTHVFSPNFGGCEWHILSKNTSHTDYLTVVFLHVFKDIDKVNQYSYDGKWELKYSITTTEILNRYSGSPSANIVAYAFIPANSDSISTAMLVLDNAGRITEVMHDQEHKAGPSWEI